MQNKSFVSILAIVSLLVTIYFLQTSSKPTVSESAPIQKTAQVITGTPPTTLSQNTPKPATTTINKTVSPSVTSSSDVFANFTAWINTPSQTKDWVNQGLILAKQRQPKIQHLIQTEPQLALQKSVSFSQYAALPKEIQAYVEQPFSDTVNLVILPNEDKNKKQNTGNRSYIDRNSGQQKQRLQVYRYGNRNHLLSKQNLAVQGIQLGQDAVIADTTLMPVNKEDAEYIQQHFSAKSVNADKFDFYTGEAIQGKAILALSGGKVFPFASTKNIQQLNTQLAQLEKRNDPHATSQLLFKYRANATTNTTSTSNQPAPLSKRLEKLLAIPSDWTTSIKKVLLIRVTTSDTSSAAVSESDLVTALTNSSNLIQQLSQNKTSLDITVSNTAFQLTQTAATYSSDQGTTDLLTEAKSLFSAANSGIDLTTYDIVGVHIGGEGLPVDWAGLASVGGGDYWLNNTIDLTTVTHEFGHIYGLSHANFWETNNASVVGAGTDEAYGDGFDMMGSGLAPQAYFHPQALAKLDWLTTVTDWIDITVSGVYRVNRFDHESATGIRGLRIARNGATTDGYYWLAHRQNYDNNAFLENGAYLIWEKSGEEKSWLIDTTPGSFANAEEDKQDAGIVLGKTYSDTAANIHITTLAKGGTAPSEWLDIQVNLGDFPSNSAPTVNLTIPTVLSARTALDFIANASDADGDTLVYQWDFGDGVIHPSSASISHTWTVGGSYTIKVTVSDMKGKTATAQQSITVTDPLTQWTDRSSTTTEDLIDIASNGTLAVAISNFKILGSSDGTTWSVLDEKGKSGTGLGFNVYLYAIIYDGSQWIAVGQDHDGTDWRGAIYTSPDAITWTERYKAGDPLQSIASSGSALVAVGNNGNAVRSVDAGITWSPVSTGISTTLRDISYGNGQFIAVGNEYITGELAAVVTSSDGATWTNQTNNSGTAVSYGFNAIAYLNDKFIASGYNTKLSYLENSGGIAFLSNRANREITPALMYGDNLYFVAGIDRDDSDKDIDLLSLDGKSWILSPNTPVVEDRNAGVFFKETFITVGNQGSIRQSDPVAISTDPIVDADNDTISDATDNCPAIANTDQNDLDTDGIGDVCDPDIDGDGVDNDQDVFPLIATESVDTDGDTVGDNSDNCPTISNTGQEDTDTDGIGDVCDSDTTAASNELTGQVTLPSGVTLVDETACLDSSQTPAVPLPSCRRVSVLLMQGSTLLAETVVQANNTYTLPFTGTLPLDAYLQVSTKFTDALTEEFYYNDFGIDKLVGGATSETADTLVPMANVQLDSNGIPTNVYPLTISATPATVDLDLSALTSSTTTNVELTGQVTLPSGVTLVDETACLDSSQTPAVPLPSCRRVSVLLMQGSTLLAETVVQANNTYTLPFTGTLPLDAYLQVSTKFTDALTEEFYYNDFGIDKLVGGATSETADTLVPMANVQLDSNGIPTNVYPLTIAAAATPVNLDLSNLTVDDDTSSEYLIEGTITVEADFVPGEIFDASGVNIGFQMLSITAIDMATGTHYRNDLTGTALENNSYAFKLSLPKLTLSGDTKNYIIRIEKFSDKNNTPEFLEVYLNDGGDYTFSGDQADSLKSAVGIDWKETSSGSGLWLPDSSKTGYFTVTAGDPDIQNYSIDLTTFGSNFYKFTGTVVLPTDFDLNDSSNHMNIEIMDAATGYYLGSSPVTCDTSSICTYTIILGDSLSSNGYLLRINQEHRDDTNWENSWYKGFYLDFGIDNALGGSADAADNIKDENDVASREVSNNGIFYFIPDVNKLVIDTSTAVSAMPAVNIDFSAYIVPTMSKLTGNIFGIPSTAQWAEVHLQDVKNATGRNVDINSDGSFVIEDVKEGKYLLEINYDIDDNGTFKNYHYILADDDGDFSVGTRILDGEEVKLIPYDSNDQVLDSFASDFNWDSVAYWAPEETSIQKVLLNVGTTDISLANVTIVPPALYDLTVNLTGVDSGKNIYVNLFVPNKPIGRWESITADSSGASSVTLKGLKAQSDYQLQFWIDGLGEFWYNGTDLTSDVSWVGKQDGSICEDWKNAISSCDFNKEVIWGPSIAGFAIDATHTLNLSIPNDRRKVTATLSLGASNANQSVDVNLWQSSGSNYAWEQFTTDSSGDVAVELSVLAGTGYRMETYIPNTGEGFVVDLGSDNAAGNGNDTLITQQNSWNNSHPWGPKTSTLIDLSNDVTLGILSPPSLNTLTFTIQNLDADEQIFIGLEGLDSNNDSNYEWYGRDNVDWSAQPISYATQISIKVPSNANGYRVMIFPQNHQGGAINDSDNIANEVIAANATMSSFSWDWDKADKITVSGDQAYIIELPATADLKSITGTVSGITGGDMTGWIEAWSPTVGRNGTEVSSDGSFTIQGLNAASDYTIEYWSDLQPNEIIKQTIDVSDNVTNISLSKSATIHTFSGTATNVSAGSSIISVLLLDVNHTSGSSNTTIDTGDTWEAISTMDAGTLANGGTYDYSVNAPPPLAGHSYAIAVGSKTVSATTGETSFTLFEASIDSNDSNTVADTAAVVIDGIDNSTNTVSISVKETIAN